MAYPAKNGRISKKYHFPQLNADGVCTKMIKPHKTGSQEPCRQGARGNRHLYYACRVVTGCRVHSWSIEERIKHETEDHEA